MGRTSKKHARKFAKKMLKSAKKQIEKDKRSERMKREAANGKLIFWRFFGMLAFCVRLGILIDMSVADIAFFSVLFPLLISLIWTGIEIDIEKAKRKQASKEDEKATCFSIEWEESGRIIGVLWNEGLVDSEQASAAIDKLAEASTIASEFSPEPKCKSRGKVGRKYPRARRIKPSKE